MLIDNQRLYKELQELQVIDSLKLDEALKSATASNLELGNVLLDADLINDIDLGELVATSAGLPFVNLKDESVSHDLVFFFTPEFATKNRIAVFRMDNSYISVASDQIISKELEATINKKSGKVVKIFYTTTRQLNHFYSLFKEMSPDSLKFNFADDLLYKLCDRAYSNNSSDIHIEPKSAYSVVRFRIDGQMKDVMRIDKSVHDQVINKIKVEAGLKTDEHLAAQDGKMKVALKDDALDVRVSIVPVLGGENCVLRLLSSKSRMFGLKDLGMSDADLNKLTAAYKKPNGMLLSTGPTGAGKTTSLYAILKLINRRETSISTIEDPVEYELEGISQIQVSTRTGLTFANGLRSILRQDPDVILVGEIRDDETANIAVNAALTGHLVLSTLHTNDSATALIRLLDMKIEPFLVSSTVNCIVAQRLVRTICEKCKVSYDPEKGDPILQNFPKTRKQIRLYKGKGCPVCNNTGYKGRIGIFEIMEISEPIRDLVNKRASSSDIMNLAKKEGMRTMYEDGIEKSLNGMTTVEEVLRVTKV